MKTIRIQTLHVSRFTLHDPCYTSPMPDNHIIGSGLTNQELQVASFWVRNRPLLTRLGYGSLTVLTVFFWGFTIWSLLDAYVISYPRETLIPRLIAQNALTIRSFESTAPQSTQPSEVLVFPTTDNRTDFAVELTNPNARWWVEFTYRFDVGSEQTPERKAFILPNNPQVLTELGWKGTTQPTSAQLHVDNIRWHRVEPNDIEKDYAAFAKKRLQLQFTDVAYKNDLQIDSHTIGQSSFTLTNPTGFGFWNVDLTVFLYRLASPVAVQKISVRELKPGEVRPIVVNWFENVNAVSRTDIRPSVNILDPNAFLPSERF